MHASVHHETIVTKCSLMPSFCARASKGFAHKEKQWPKKVTGTWTAVKLMNPCLQDWNAVKPWLLNTDPSKDPIKSIKALSTIKIETTGFFLPRNQCLGNVMVSEKRYGRFFFQVEIRKCSLGILVFLCFFVSFSKNPTEVWGQQGDFKTHTHSQRLFF